MACFIVSAAEAAVVTVAEKVVEKREKNEANSSGESQAEEIKIPLHCKLKWLKNMLAGGSVLLAFEHVWHGEVVPWFPFFTAMNDPADAAEMFHEMATVGVSMAVLVTAVWAVMAKAADAVVKRSAHEAADVNEA